MVESRTAESTSKLFNKTPVDIKDELDERLEKCHSVVLGLTRNLSEKESMDCLQSNRGQARHDEIQLGLLYGVLTDSSSASKYFKTMSLVSQDGLGKAVNMANQLICEKWLKLTDITRLQLTWLSKELITNRVLKADHVCHFLLRQIAGGDVSVRNISLTEIMLKILSDNMTWLDMNPKFIPMVVYTFLRVIMDHHPPPLLNLRQREVTFCIKLLREKWAECQVIGRDLVRFLQGLVRINEFNELWKDIQDNPTALSPQFGGLKQLMETKTSKSFIVSRLTPDMEYKLNFFTMNVNLPNHKRYQEWFQRQYLSTPESQTLLFDLIRFVCAAIHPPKEIIRSNVIPRWAVIGWLITTCASNVVASNATFALFYDWLFYDPAVDSIMDIEPCILLMVNSLKSHPAITEALLDFMCKIPRIFCPSLTSSIRQGICASLNSILERKVLLTLEPLFECSKINKEIQAMMKESYPEFCSNKYCASKEESMRDQTLDVVSQRINSESNFLTTSVEENVDEDLEIDVDRHITPTPTKMECELESCKTQSCTLQESCLLNLEEEIRELLVQMNAECDKEAQCEWMHKLVQQLIDLDFEKDDMTNLATCVCQILSEHFQQKLMPREMDHDSIEEPTGMPLFVLFRNIHQFPEHDPSRQKISVLLEEMYKIQPKIGYYFLYFLDVTARFQPDVNVSVYKDLHKTLGLESQLISDLRLCYEDDELILFAYLITYVYSQFSSAAIGNIELLQLVVSSIDGAQLLELVCKIHQGQLVMFSKDSFLSVLDASLHWETCEQYFLWKLVSGHKMPVSIVLPILPKLVFKVHSEAMTNIIDLLKQDAPRVEILRPLLSREYKKNDLFTVSILNFWIQKHGDEVADQMSSFFDNTFDKLKLNHSNKSACDQPSVEQVLCHLDHLRSSCKSDSFFTETSIHQTLQNVQMFCSDALKVKFFDLFNLVGDVDSSSSVLHSPSQEEFPVMGASYVRPGKRAAPDDLHEMSDDDEYDDDDDDDDIVHFSNMNKTKRARLIDDDSDTDVF